MLASKNYPNGMKKSDLPRKTCPVCQKDFTWRKNGKRTGKRSNTVVKGAGVPNERLLTNRLTTDCKYLPSVSTSFYKVGE